MNNKASSSTAPSPISVKTDKFGNELSGEALQTTAQANRLLEYSIAFGLLGVAIVIFAIHFFAFRHSFPPINTDEASFFSPAKSFVERGDLASDIHKSFLPGAGLYTYWMPPLYIVLLGSFLKIFGGTVVTAKVMSVLLTCASAVLLAALAKERFTKAAVAGLFLLCPFILITSAFIRVESLAIFLTVLAIVSVKKGWHDWLLGAIAAVGIMTHPLMLACAGGLGLTSLRRGVKPVLLFSLGFAIAISPYIWYILHDVQVFKEQMTLQFLRKAQAKLFDVKPMYLLQSVPLVLLALFCLSKVKAQNELRLFLAVSIVLALAVVLRSNEFNYQVYLVPYSIAALLLAMEYRRDSALFRWIAPGALAAFFALLLVSKLVKYKFRTDTDFNELTSHLATAPAWKGKKIFVSGGPDVSTYLLMYGEQVERQVPVPQTLPANWLDSFNYVIEVRENGAENIYEEEGKPRPWRQWRPSAFTTSDGVYTLTEYAK